MSGSKSSSSSQSQTQSIQEDNRIVTESGGVSLGKDAILQINNELPETVANVFKDLIDLARDAGGVVLQSAGQSVQTAERALDQVATIQDSVNQGTNRYLIPLVMAGLGILAIATLKKG